MNQQQVIAELVKGIPAATVALIIGLVAAYIAFHQYRVARDKLRLDLFERRYELYDGIWALLSQFEKATNEIRDTVSNSIPKAHFLFGEDVAEFFTDVLHREIQLRSALAHLKSHPPGTKEHEDAKPRVEQLARWRDEELNNLRKRFKPYLGFQKWQHN